MSVLLLLLLPLLAECSEWETTYSHVASCKLPPASTEKFAYSTEGNTWHLQYQYVVPGLSDLGCLTYNRLPGKKPNEVILVGNFSKVSLFPVESHLTLYGNRYHKQSHGVWNCLLSGPNNMVIVHKDFYVNHFCFLGYEASQIFTSVKHPSEKLMKWIWKVVDEHPEVDKHRFKKVLC